MDEYQKWSHLLRTVSDFRSGLRFLSNPERVTVLLDFDTYQRLRQLVPSDIFGQAKAGGFMLDGVRVEPDRQRAPLSTETLGLLAGVG